MRLHLLPHDALENVFSHLSTTDIIATASASPLLTLALSTILQRSHLVLDATTKNQFLSCPTDVANYIRHLSISGRILPYELKSLSNVFTALDDVSFNISSGLPSAAWFEFLVVIAPSLRRCAVEFCANLPGDLILEALGANCRNLQNLTLRFTPHVYALDIEPFLINVGRSLRVLRLEDCIGVDDQVLISIARNCNILECLCVGGSEEVGDDGILAITESPCAATLSTLDIRSCMQVTDEGVYEIATSCHALKSLNLWEVCVTTYGVRCVAEGLGEHLETLVIGDCIGVDDIAAQSIADNCESLVTLEMCGLRRITDEGVMALFDTNRLGDLDLQYLTIDRCTNVTSRGVLAATGLLDNARTASRACQLHMSCTRSNTPNRVPTPLSANEHADVRKRKQSRDTRDADHDQTAEGNETETDNHSAGEDWQIPTERGIPQQYRADMVESCNPNASQAESYVSHLKKLSAIETKVGLDVWKFIRDCRNDLDLVADDCGTVTDTDEMMDRCLECKSSENCVDGVVVSGHKPYNQVVYQTNGESNITNVQPAVTTVRDAHSV